MSLIEVLVTVTVMGLVASVVAAATIVVLRQQQDTQARVDVARWEQALALWMPADLASASDVDADPAARPPGCGAACDDSSNVLELSWGVAPDVTEVSYRYGRRLVRRA